MKTALTKLSTVNVIHIDTDGVVRSVVSFPDDPEGNKQAEALFVARIKDATSATAYNEDEFQAMIDEGISDDAVESKFFITHSDTEPESV